MAHETDTRTLAIADDVDLIASIPAATLIAALEIALVQIDESDDDFFAAYGVTLDHTRDAAATQIRLALVQIAANL